MQTQVQIVIEKRRRGYKVSAVSGRGLSVFDPVRVRTKTEASQVARSWRRQVRAGIPVETIIAE